MNQATSTFGTNPGVPGNIISQTNVINFEAERLLNNGIWIDINANMAFGAGPAGLSPYSIANDYGINGKVGYAFPMLNQHLQIIPYALIGLNNTASAGGGLIALTANPQIANSFVYTGGIGGRLEYRINRAVLLYADQLVGYNWDQSGPQFGIMPQNNMLYTSTLGAKFNIVKNLQIGVRGYYNNYQPMAGNMIVTPIATSFAPQTQNSFGGLVSVGLTY